MATASELLRLGQDRLSLCQTAIELEHSKIHAGQAFQFVADVTLNGTTPAYRLFRTGNQALHFKEIRIVTEVPNFELSLFEAPTVTNAGTLQSNIIPFNRVQSQVLDLSIFTAPTIGADGTLLDIQWMPGEDGAGQNKFGDTKIDNWEFIFKPNTDYLIKGFRTIGTGDYRVIVKYRWYIGGPIK